MTNKDKLLKYYRQMLLIRAFEEKLEELFTTGVCSGTVHTCVGQEAVAVGVASVLRKKDVVTSTHRGHGHFIAHGGDHKRIMAEIFGKAAGYSGGRGGSQLMADYTIGFMGANGIVGGSIPVATGMALHFKLNNQKRIAACFFGDGAVNQGTFHESLNMASLWKLPIIYLCENNLYAMSTHMDDGMAHTEIATKVTNYNMPGICIDGNDLLMVQKTVKEAIKKVDKDQGPMLIEFETYRFSGHSRGDKMVYRSREEEKDWRKRDPIRRFRSYLIGQKIISSLQDKEVQKEIKTEIKKTVQFAKKSPWPELEKIKNGVFA